MKVQLNAAERAENRIRADYHWAPKLRVACNACGTESRFATRDELAVERWRMYGIKKLCPPCWTKLAKPNEKAIREARIEQIDNELEALESKIDTLVAERTKIETQRD